jgi:hypothetical protein
MASLKQKGDLAELKVAADLLRRGCRLSIPFGEDSDYDLIADFEGRLHRVQAKFTESDGSIYDQTSDRCYYCPSSELGDVGRSELRLRLTPARNGQLQGIRNAADYLEPDLRPVREVEPAGIEPATSCLQSTRSSN